ncbi:hypothetical protein CMO96_03345 [Candidatus Woesebacteria bacterium]|nr:hypothetical protein [Candidatus Woesebacteria bacterium]
MKALSSLTASDIQNIKLLSFDADGVTVEQGTKVLERDGVLTVTTKQITKELLAKINRLKKHFHINFSSGRSLLYLNKMFGPALWDKASIQGENGLFTLIDGKVVQADRITLEELEKTEAIKSEIHKLAETDKNITGFEPKQFELSVHCHKEDPGIEDIVRRIDTKGEFYVYWVAGESYDIFLKRFSKGAGLKFLAKHLKIDISETLAVGNDPNDVPMLEVAGISITTNPKKIPADYQTEKEMALGGDEVADKLLELTK